MTDAVGPVWLISGCSSGFGRELAIAVLNRGWRVAATARNPSVIADIVARAPDRAIALPLDVREEGHVKSVVDATVERFGGVDVLVNNAGYGYQSSFEEGVEQLVRAMFDTNLFGLIRLTQAVLPQLRAQRRGHIFNIGSIAGVVGTPSASFYSASKHAVEGLSEALAGEVKALGIGVTVVEPGPFRTDFGGRSLSVTPAAIDDYADRVGALIEAAARGSGHQQGDPTRAAEAIIDAYLAPNTPENLVLGQGATQRAEAKFRARLEELEQWRHVSDGADFPA